jgi:hypothetical protein
MINSFLFGALVVYSMGFLFSIAGTYFIRPLLDTFSDAIEFKKMRFLLGYIAGLSFFFSFWKLTDFLFQSAKISFFISLIPLIFLTLIQLRAQKFAWKSLIQNGVFFLFLACLVQILCTTFWSREIFTGAFSTMGSGHSPRFANITFHTIEIDRIPIFGLNYVQSILSAGPMYFGGSSPLVYLSLWLGLSMTIFTLLTYFIFRWFKLSVLMALLATFFVGFGNTAASINQYLVMDTGSPYFLASYSDTLHSIGILLLILIILFSLLFKNEKVLDAPSLIKLYFTLGTLFFMNTLLAPQNIVVILAIFGVLFLYFFFSKSTTKKFKKIYSFSTLILLFTFLIGSQSGGFLTPTSKHDPAELPGIEHFKTSSVTPVISLSIPYHLGSFRNWQMAESSNDPFFNQNESTITLIQKFFHILLKSIFVMFFPVLGLLLVYFRQSVFLPVRFFLIVSLIAFLCGIILVWPVNFYGSKWAFTRFFIPGVYFSQICFCLGLYSVVSKLKISRQVLIMSSITVFACWGPFNNFISIVYENFTNTVVFENRLQSIVDYTKIQTK